MRFFWPAVVAALVVMGRALAQDPAASDPVTTPDAVAVDPAQQATVVATSDAALPTPVPAAAVAPSAAPAPGATAAAPAPSSLPPGAWAPAPVTAPPPTATAPAVAPSKKPPPPPSSLTLFKPHRTKSCTECRETKFIPTVKPKTVVYYTTITMIGHSTVAYVTAVNIGSPARNGPGAVAGDSNGVRPGTIVGIVVACLAFVAILAAVVWHYARRNRSARSRLGPISAPVLQVEKYEGPSRPRTPLTPREGSRDLPRISAYGTLRRSVGEEDEAAENGNGAGTRPVRPSPLRKSVVYPDGYEGEAHAAANSSPESRYSQPDVPGAYYANAPTMPQPYAHTERPSGDGFLTVPHEQYEPQPRAAPDPAALAPRYQLYPDPNPVDEEASIGRRGGATRSGSTFGPSTLMPPLREDTVLESRWSHSTSSAEQHDGVGRAR